MPIIELDNLSKWYGEVIGLNNVTASIGSGMTGLVGPNGAGKTTLMGLIMGQLKPSKGEIRVLGKPPWNTTSVLSRIGYCPEGDPFWNNVSGKRFVTFLAKASGLSGSNCTKAVARAIELTGMTEQAHRAIGGYSKGMRQRIKIAQALVHDPELLILDEPFTGADPIARHDLGVLFKELADNGVDVLISSHVLHEVEALTKRIMMIDHGRIVAHGALRDVRRTLHNRPHGIRLKLAEPRRLAAKLAEMDVVSGLNMSEPQTLLIETTHPDKVHQAVCKLVLQDNLEVKEIAAADEGLEALFGYLTHREN